MMAAMTAGKMAGHSVNLRAEMMVATTVYSWDALWAYLMAEPTVDMKALM